MSNNTKYIDYLDESDPPPNQKYFLVCFLSPENIKNTSLRGIKVFGSFPDYNSAKKKVEELSKNEQYFDIHIGELGKWLPWDPSFDQVEDVVYQEKELNDLMKKYKENQDKAREMEKQRKHDMIKNAAKNEKKKKDKNNKTKNIGSSYNSQKFNKNYKNNNTLNNDTLNNDDNTLNNDDIENKNKDNDNNNNDNNDELKTNFDDFSNKINEIKELYNKYKE